MVTIKKTKDGSIVTAFSGNPEYGYVIVHSVENVFQNGWMEAKERSAIIRGQVEMLGQAFATVSELPGKIAVSEFTEDTISAKFLAGFQKDLSVEEAIAPFIKRAGDGGPILMSGGKRIVRFTEYDANGTQADVRVAHDNIDEIVAHNVKSKAEADFDE